MPKLWALLRGLESQSEKRYSLSEYFTQFAFGGVGYAVGGGGSPMLDREQIENSFTGYVRSAYKSNGIVFACMLTRLMIFGEARFQFQRMNNGRPGDLFDTPDLRILDRPWPNGTTGELLSRAIQDADLAGNFYVAREGSRLRRLRPDWVEIVLTAAPADAVESDVAGYLYRPGGVGSTAKSTLYLPEQVAHWSPIPDPEAQYRGMSWLTPVTREIQADQGATLHKERFFANAATPNLAVALKETVTEEQFKKFMEAMNEAHQGAENAYKCLHPSTDVAMWDGRRVPAGEVVVGDRVVAWSDGHATPGTVVASEIQIPSPIVTVTTQRGRVIKTNDRHPFLLRDGSWIDAADLKRGDLLTTGLAWASDDNADTLTAHQAWMLGVVTGDGCTTSTTPVVSAWDEGVRSRLEIGYILKSTGKGHDYRLLGVRSLCVTTGLMGKRSWEKRIPVEVMTGSPKIRAAFLSGLIDTDGHVSDPDLRRSAEVGITSTSRDLLADAQHLLASLGVNASLSLSMPASRGDGRGRDAWRLIALGNDQARRLAEFLDLACESKSTRLATYAGRPSRQDRSRVDRVISVEIGAPEATVGIEIAEYHTHITGGVVTHNTLYLGGGADVTVVGSDFKQIDFKATQGAGETRIAADAGVHPVIVGLSEGMQGSSLNAGNFNSARRLVADKTMRPLWRSVCAAFSPLVKVPPNSRLWFDDRDIAFLREDRKDLADIQSTEAQTIRALVDGGYDPATVTPAVMNQDWSLLVHTGKLSVQLQSPDQASAAEDDASADGAIASATAPAKSAADAKLITEMVQKVYLGVGKVITADEARRMLNDAGANLDIPGPLAEPEAEPANTDPQNADPTAEEGE